MLVHAQAVSVQGVLAGCRLDVELVETKTTGDRTQDELTHRLGKTGALVRTLDERVLGNEVDAAVHLMKDMPTEKPVDLTVAGMPERAPTGDVLITAEGHDIDDLPEGAVIGTSSFRRQAQLLNHHDDLEVEPLWSNVDTCIEKLLITHLQHEYKARVENGEERRGKKGRTDHDKAFDETTDRWLEGLTGLERQAPGRQVETEYDAIVLMETGLRCNGLTEKMDYKRLPWTTLVPVPGRGVAAVTAADSMVIEPIRDELSHPRTHVETTAEQTIPAEPGDDRITLAGVHALLQGEHVHVDMQVLTTDGSESIRTPRDLLVGNHVNATREFVAALCDHGVGQLVDAAREEVEERDDG